MKGASILAAASILLAGCALPLVSTEFDPGSARKYHRTGTHFPVTVQLPKSWRDTNLHYMGKDEVEDLVRRQKAMNSN